MPPPLLPPPSIPRLFRLIAAAAAAFAFLNSSLMLRLTAGEIEPDELDSAVDGGLRKRNLVVVVVFVSGVGPLTRKRRKIKTKRPKFANFKYYS